MAKYKHDGTLNFSLLQDLENRKDVSDEAAASIRSLETLLGVFVVNAMEASDALDEQNLSAFGIRVENILREAKELAIGGFVSASA